MALYKHKWSFCRDCRKNVPHYREFKAPVLRFLDALSLGILGWFRIGPWYCIHCERKTNFLAGERYEAPNFRSPLADANPEPNVEDDKTPRHVAQPVGNYIRKEESLVIRSERLKRFSEKYRDSVVRRIFSGQASMVQVRQEENLSEGEILDWMADLFDRMQSKLDFYHKMLGTPPTLEIQPNQADEFPSDSIPDGPVVEGKAKPK